VRMLIRAAVMVAAAAGLCLALSQVASADVVEPKSAYQPASVGLLEEKEAAKVVAEEPAKADPKTAEAKEEKPDEVVVATPAPEQVVRQAPALAPRSAVTTPEPSLAHRITHPLRVGFREIGASLGRVVGACDVGFGSGAGGPVLVFAVVALATPFIRRRVFATRWTADEDVPEFLFARELTPPG